MAHLIDPVFTDLIQTQNVKINANIATPSLSYEPATLLEIYEGTIDMNKAANSPDPFLPVASFVNKQVANAVNPANEGAKKTQTFLISTGNPIKWNA